MPISHTDRISGTIYVIASSAERAGDRAIDYLRDKTESYNVFDEQKDADQALHNKYAAHGEGDRVYSFTIDVQPTEQ
ncbi:hypothetical protein [Streptomyces nigrescens]|uniref:hypothetical protein n=1 Tax=Streptomyces nigrescens TaxID=1920 RepID=UPI003683724E